MGLNERSTNGKSNLSRRNHAIIMVLILLFGMTLCFSNIAFAEEPTKEEQQSEIRKMAKETLSELYKVQPNAKKQVSQSVGYGVFSNFGLKILFVGSGTGTGLVVNNQTKDEVFMKMIEAQVGLGLGGKKFKQIWVFKTSKALNDFVNSGWEAGAQGTAAAKSGKEGAAMAGAIAVDQDILLYQLTDAGLALEFTAKGTKYYKNDDLN